MLFFVSPRSVVSEHCRRELNFAQEEGREVIAVHLEPTEMPAGLRLGLNNRQAILKYKLDEDEFHKRLMRVVQGAEGSMAGQVPASGRNPRTWRAGITLAGIALFLIAVGTLWFIMRDVAPADSGPEAIKTADGVAAQESSNKSIAVLPFVNMSSDPEQEYFSDGISEELLNLLAKNPELKVISRSSAFTFKDKDIDIPAVAERLGVAHVLEGSVRKAGNRVRITAQLIDAETDTHLWSDTFDRELTDIFAIQDEIAGQVVDALKLALFGTPATTKEPNLDAYALYLQGRHLGAIGTPENLDQAEALLKRALALDPDYADVWIELSSVYESKRFIGTMAVDRARSLKHDALERARAIDPENAGIYEQLAWDALIEDRDLTRAARLLERGLALDPTRLSLIQGAALLALNLGRLADAVARAEYVTARDPLCALCIGQLGGMYMLQDRIDEAAAAYETYDLVGGDDPGMNAAVALVLLLQGKHEASLARWNRVTPGHLFRAYGETITLYSMGREADFAAKFQELKDQFGTDYPTMVARVYAWMGDVDTAFEWLDRYTGARPELGPVIINHFEFLSVEFQPLHDDPRWQAYLERLGLAPEQLAAIEFEFSLPK
jgi:TolB-like protein